MFVDPKIFTFIPNWSEADRVKAAKIVAMHGKKYKTTYSYDDIIAEAYYAVVVAWKRYGNTMIPENISGYVRGYLRRMAKAQNVHLLELPDHVAIDAGNEYRDMIFMESARKVLTAREFGIFHDVFVEGKKLTEVAVTRKEMRRIYEKLMELIYD